MQPKRMNEFLRDSLPDHVWQTRRKQIDSRVFIEFLPQDVELLHRLGIEVDDLGPRLVVCMWDEAHPLQVGGYLVIDNLAMGLPAMGGIRMLPDVTPSVIHNLARGMTMKNAAAELPYGGAKAGIISSPNLSPADHTEVVRAFAHLIRPYTRLYNPGPDVGTNDQDMKTLAIENGLDVVVSKPVEMGGNRIDQLGAAANGVVIALKTLREQIERLRPLSQFRNVTAPSWKDVTVIVQGFGAVGANVARILWEEGGREGTGPKVIGVSDAAGYLYSASGLDVGLLLTIRGKNQIVSKPYFLAHPEILDSSEAILKFSSARDDLLRESAFALIPAAPQANYLDVDASSNPSMTIDKMGRWSLIIEGANTYSPAPRRKAARRRMERRVYQERGTLIAPDFLVNSGGVIFAAHERLIPTPEDLHIPADYLGKREAVDRWLKDHASEFAALAERRRIAAEKKQQVIQKNMIELIDGLLADDDALPCQVAESISINRIVHRESKRLASEVMVEMPQIITGSSIQQAAQTLVSEHTDVLCIHAPDGQVVGIVTDWDITKAAARGQNSGVPVDEIMSRQVISCSPESSILEIVRMLEQYDISAVPVLTPEGKLVGAVTADVLATRTLYRLLLGDREVSSSKLQITP